MLAARRRRPMSIASASRRPGAWRFSPTTTPPGRRAFDAADAGVEVAAIVDPRPAVSAALIAGARSRGLRVILGGEVIATHGKTPVSDRCLCRRRDRRGSSATACAMSGGLTPNRASHLPSRRQAALEREIAAFVPGRLTARHARRRRRGRRLCASPPVSPMAREGGAGRIGGWDSASAPMPPQRRGCAVFAHAASGMSNAPKAWPSSTSRTT